MAAASFGSVADEPTPRAPARPRGADAGEMPSGREGRTNDEGPPKRSHSRSVSPRVPYGHVAAEARTGRSLLARSAANSKAARSRAAVLRNEAGRDRSGDPNLLAASGARRDPQVAEASQ